MNMQVEALALPRACYNFSPECTTVRWKKSLSKGSGVNFWHSRMNSAFRLYKRCGIQISTELSPVFSQINLQATEQVITELVENHFNDLLNGSE